MKNWKAPALVALVTLTACDRDALYTQSTFSENVYNAYEECSASEIRFLTSKHNIQTAFEPCGSNNFVHYSWAPDGVQLYFQLPMSAHIMNGNDKTIGTMPTAMPTADVAWLSREFMVLPTQPEGSATPELVLFDRVQASMQTLPLDVEAPRDLMPTGATDGVLFTAEDQGVRNIYSADFTTREVRREFEFVKGSVDTFTFEPAVGQLVVGQGDLVQVFQADGTPLETFAGAHRGSVHAEGQYIALETKGQPISPFDQRTWNELSDSARERELRRMEEWLDNQPEWVTKEVHPPVLDMFDRSSESRYRFTSFYGDRFQWYPNNPQLMYASFVIWGLEGKEMNRNVALTQLFERLRMASKGEIPMGMERVDGPATDPPAEETVSPETPPEAGG